MQASLCLFHYNMYVYTRHYTLPLAHTDVKHFRHLIISREIFPAPLGFLPPPPLNACDAHIYVHHTLTSPLSEIHGWVHLRVRFIIFYQSLSDFIVSHILNGKTVFSQQKKMFHLNKDKKHKFNFFVLILSLKMPCLKTSCLFSL